MLVKFVIDGTRPQTDFIARDWSTLVHIMTNCWDEDSSKRPFFSELRHRITHNATSDIEESAARSKDAWERSRATNENSVTHPKIFRSADNGGYRQSASALMDDSEPEQRLRGINPPPTSMRPAVQESLPDLSTRDVLISADSGHVSSTSTSKEIEYNHYPDGASNEPLLANSPTFSPGNRFCKCGGSKVALCILCIILGCGAAFAVFWFTLYSQNAGCCINCFDLSTPLLKGNCSASDNTRAPVGSKCNFSCPDGYVLNGNTNELYCGQTGIWSGPLPYCRKIRQCQSLNPPANLGGIQCTNGWYEGSECSFQCKEGYRLRLPGDVGEASPEDMSITCNADDIENYQWSGPEPYCEKVVQCEQLSHDDNVDVSCEPSGLSYSNGTVCQLLCKDTHMSLEYEGSVTLCSKDGKWNVTKEIKCLNACSSLPPPPNGVYKCNNDRKYSSTCTYSCDTGFFLVGPQDIACQNSGSKRGTWSADPPTCVCPSCRSGKNCENSVSFNGTWETLNSTQNTVFDGRTIRCKETPKAILKSGDQMYGYGCQCKDVNSNLNKQCNDKDAPTACKKAYGSLLLIMSTKQICSLPCDAEYMPGLKC